MSDADQVQPWLCASGRHILGLARRIRRVKVLAGVPVRYHAHQLDLFPRPVTKVDEGAYQVEVLAEITGEARVVCGMCGAVRVWRAEPPLPRRALVSASATH